jgi:glycosyltransferase involved in cell wall biosynthesis
MMREIKELSILAIAPSLWFGGAQVVTLELFNLMKSRVKLKVLTCDGADPKFLDALNSMGIETYRVPCRTLLGYPILAIGQARKLVEWADVVWITDVEYSVAPRIKRVKNVPVVAHIHSYALVCPWWGAMYGLKEVCTARCSAWRIVGCKQGINRELARVGLLDGVRAGAYWLLDFGKGPLDYFRWRRVMDSVVDSVDVFVAVSNATRDVVVSHLPEVRDRVEVVYNPAAHRPWRYVSSLPEERGNFIFYAGGAHLNKGPHILLRAFKLLMERGIDVGLVMTGTAGTWVEALARRYGVGQGVRFLEKLPEGEYFRLMAGAGATVLPSVWPEPLPTVAVESVSLGVPVVGSGLGGIPEIVDKYGAVAPPLPEKIAEAVVKVLEMRYDREEMRLYAHKKFGVENVERLVEIFNKVAGSRG